MQKQIVIFILMVVLTSAFYKKESGACCTRNIQYMDSTGACKDKHANCVKISYANSAHDNNSQTGCDCGVSGCSVCSSTTECGTCTPATFDRTANWNKKTGTNCAGTPKKVYCANGAEVSCDGTCTAPASGSGCGQLMFKAGCAEYRLKDEGTNGIKYQDIPMSGNLVADLWKCVKCTTGTKLTFLTNGGCSNRDALKSQVKTGPDSICLTVATDLTVDKCSVCRDNNKRWLENGICKVRVATKGLVDAGEATALCAEPADDKTTDACKKCKAQTTNFLDGITCKVRVLTKSKIVNSSSVCKVTSTDQTKDECKTCRTPDTKWLNGSKLCVDRTHSGSKCLAGAYDPTADRCEKCVGSNVYKTKYWDQSLSNNNGDCKLRTDARSKNACSDTGYDSYADSCKECATPTKKYWDPSTNACKDRAADKSKDLCNAADKYDKLADKCTKCANEATKWNNSGACTPRVDSKGDVCKAASQKLDSDKCPECLNDATHWANNGKCEGRTNSKNDVCTGTKFTKISDNCLLCLTPKAKYSKDGKCEPRSNSASKCKDDVAAFSPLADSCEECLAGINKEYWNTSTNKCTARVKSLNMCQAGQYNKFKDECNSGKCLFTDVARALTTCEPCTGAGGTSPNFTCDAGALSTIKCITNWTLQQTSQCNKKDGGRVATVVSNKDNQAATCKVTYQLDSDNKLCFKGYNAKTLLANKITVCEPRFEVAENKLSCVRCPTNCKTCLTGCDLGCLTCMSANSDPIKANTKCLCKDTYFNYGGVCKIKTSYDIAAPNAKYAQKIAECCKDGKYLDNAGACQDCHLSCKTCIQYFITGANIATDKNKCLTHKVANCKVSTKADKCTDTCVDGYRVNTEVCEKCTPENCKNCDDAKATCKTCNTGYTGTDGKCYKNIANCAATKTVKEKCTLCNAKWIKKADELSCEACAPKCNACTKVGECTSGQCQEGTFFKDNKCADCPANCKVCTAADACSTCKTIKDVTLGEKSIYVDDAGQCDAKNYIQCDPSGGKLSSKVSGKAYFECKNAPTTQQKAHIPKCKVFRGESIEANSALRCVECETNFTLKADYTKCLPTPCPKSGTQHQYNKAGVCTNTLLKCKTFKQGAETEEEECLTCDDNKGYKWVSGTKICYPCSANCKTCSATACTACNPGYTLSGSDGMFCTKCTPANCKTCDDNHKKICDVCNDGFGTVDGAACKACPAKCKKCDYQDAAGKTLCSECNANHSYDAAKNECNIIANCNVLEFSNTKCKKCNPGFSPTKTGTECVPCVTGAVECGSNCGGSGIKCKSSSALIQNQTTCACIGTLTWDTAKKECNCANGTATGSKCTACNADYELKADACSKKAAAKKPADSSGAGSGSSDSSSSSTTSSSSANILSVCFFVISLMIAVLL